MSQLKKHIPKTAAVSEDLTAVDTDPVQVQQPEKILNSRVIQRGANRVKQLLVKWSLMPADMATWEDEAEISRDKFRIQQTEDSLVLKTGEVS